MELWGTVGWAEEREGGNRKGAGVSGDYDIFEHFFGCIVQRQSGISVIPLSTYKFFFLFLLNRMR